MAKYKFPVCGEFAASLVPRMGLSFSCVLEQGHEGPHRPGGTCVRHGPYVADLTTPNKCPHWPMCAKEVSHG